MRSGSKNPEQFHRDFSRHHNALLEFTSKNSSQNSLHLGGATIRELLHLISEIKDTLERIDQGRFGQCVECDGVVELERLELDYARWVCPNHCSKSQIQALEFAGKFFDDETRMVLKIE
ncbi:MAG: hypothetical protein Kow0042_13370 [Calditrichia bacterium]